MNALQKVPKALEKELHRRLRRIWNESADHEEAVEALGALAEELAPEHPDLADWLDVEGQETLFCFHFPAKHRLRIRTTNGNERINQELYRRSRVVRIFPNPASVLLKVWHEDWVTGRRYLRMEPLVEQRKRAKEGALERVA